MNPILTDLPGSNQTVIAYAIAHQGGAAAVVRRVIAEADYLEQWQREALLGAIQQALS